MRAGRRACRRASASPVKLPREITHERRLADPAAPLERLLGEASALGAALGPLLVQLPPSLRFDAALAEGFLAALRARFEGEVVCEPRHASWFSDEAEALLAGFRVARVAADPAVVPRAAQPGGWAGLSYRRLHGSPEMYRSPYPPAALDALAAAMHGNAWCIFDNTALGEATGDAAGPAGSGCDRHRRPRRVPFASGSARCATSAPSSPWCGGPVPAHSAATAAAAGARACCPSPPCSSAS
jgi:uncharacterized protein YecE (DUF72 family)